jgi:hypothetical protein
MRVPLGTQNIWADALDEDSGSQHAVHRGLRWRSSALDALERLDDLDPSPLMRFKKNGHSLADNVGDPGRAVISPLMRI